MNEIITTNTTGPNWKGLFKAGGIAALGMLAIMIAQIAIYISAPPPTSVVDFFALFKQSTLLGLLSLDLLYLLNNTLLILIYLALYAALKEVGESTALIALVLGLMGIAAYFSSNTAFEIMSLSNQYNQAVTADQRIILQSAAQAMLETYKGTSFDVYYVLNAAALLIFDYLLIKSNIFTKTTAVFGVLAGVLMLIPSTAGTIGLVFSLASLIPWAVFCVLIAIRFFQLGKIQGSKPERENRY